MAKIFSEIDCISYGSMDSFQKATNYCIEAKKYQQVQFYQKAIEAYNEALTYFMFFMASAEVGDVVCLDSQIMLLFWLLGLVDKVKECYGKLSEPYKSLIFQNKLEEIVETIGKYEKNLSPEQFIAYKNLSKGIKLIYEEIPLEASKAVLENLSQVVDNSDDPTFIEMVSNYDKCCSYKTLLLPSKGVSIIETKEQRPVQISHVVAAIFFPPLGVYLTVGLGTQFWINLVLTFAFTWIPGVIHALWLVFNHD
ncbi:YqaE/Pmp3 family membrane protein [Microcoleus sp. herbarium14]|uniref:YqaE/Pmp3 family membrane protein n=1 Tax=Microcoleus sp. herbarium14 TaxID=3055439 RepID=UPI002FD795A5